MIPGNQDCCALSGDTVIAPVDFRKGSDVVEYTDASGSDHWPEGVIFAGLSREPPGKNQKQRTKELLIYSGPSARISKL
jgi:hypothetical protein